MPQSLRLRTLMAEDCPLISRAFADQGWDKSISQYEHYLNLQAEGVRDIILAEWEGEFAGYLTIQWKSGYAWFRERGIPEVVDLNVLKKFQRRGIASAMMDEAESRIKTVSNQAGIGVGMTPDYGAAQQMYVRRGYIPNGEGLHHEGHVLAYGDQVEVDDGLVLYLTKVL